MSSMRIKHLATPRRRNGMSLRKKMVLQVSPRLKEKVLRGWVSDSDVPGNADTGRTFYLRKEWVIHYPGWRVYPATLIIHSGKNAHKK